MLGIGAGNGFSGSPATDLWRRAAISGQPRGTHHVTDEAKFGRATADVVRGGSGFDWLFGNSGRDLVVGNTGADHLFGGLSADRLNSRDNAPTDVSRGGAGADTCLSDPGDSEFSCN